MRVSFPVIAQIYFEEEAWAAQQAHGYNVAEWFGFAGFRDDLRRAVFDLAVVEARDSALWALLRGFSPRLQVSAP